MNLLPFNFETLSWEKIPKEKHEGETGFAWWQIKTVNDIRVRLVEYSPGYKANHWCRKGHILYCIEGEMNTRLEDGRVFKLDKGMCYFVGDNCEPHLSSTDSGCKLLIVD
jgi:quercetin dioxygenase-like cupin family protein